MVEPGLFNDEQNGLFGLHAGLSFGFHQDGESTVNVGIADNDRKFIGGTDDFGDVDIVPSQLFENVVVNTRTDGVFGRKFDRDGR